MAERETGRNVLCRLREGVAFLCAVLMLCVLPLIVHDAFFDINRIKVRVVLYGVPPLFAVMLLLHCLSRKFGAIFRRRSLAMDIALLLFLAACVIACARTGFESAVLTGSEGRYCGLLFLLCCGAAYSVISTGRAASQMLILPASLCGALCALLGVINAFGIDPFGFYAQIKKTQIAYFVSTIGNVDFFGAYLAMIFPLAAAHAVFSRGGKAVIYALLAMGMALGICASRSDTAYFAMHLSLMMLVALAGDDSRCMVRALLLWATAWVLLPVMQIALMRGAFEIYISGALLLLCRAHVPQCMAVALLAAAVFFRHKGVAPGRRRLMRTGLFLVVLALCIALMLVVYFTWINADAEIGQSSAFLRFDDAWGTRRGFVYRRTLYAYRDFSPEDKLFGRGVDITERILSPYFDDEKMLAYGVFNDAHNQPLQYLITTGLFGALSLLAFHALSLRALMRSSGKDAVLCGGVCALCGYSLIGMLSVAQPILMATYFSIAALAASRLNDTRTEGEHHEPCTAD